MTVSLGPHSHLETQISLTHRVSLSKGLSVDPLSFTAKPSQMGMMFFFLLVGYVGH